MYLISIETLLANCKLLLSQKLVITLLKDCYSFSLEACILDVSNHFITLVIHNYGRLN